VHAWSAPASRPCGPCFRFFDVGHGCCGVRYAAHFALVLYGSPEHGSASKIFATENWFVMWMVINAVFAASVLMNNEKVKAD